MDPRQYLSLVAAIDRALVAVPPETRATSGDAMPNAYRTLRAKALKVVPEHDRGELELLCPPWVGPTGGPFGFVDDKVAAAYDEARALLGILAGHLQGYADQIGGVIEAEGRARAQAKPPVGFSK